MTTTHLGHEVALFVLGGAINASAYALVAFSIHSAWPSEVIFATSAGYLTSVIVSFVFNATFTFRKGDVGSITQALKYLSLCVFGYLYNVLVIWISVSLISVQFYFAVIFITVTWPILSFTISKLFVFR